MHLCGVMTTQHMCKMLVSLLVSRTLELQYVRYAQYVTVTGWIIRTLTRYHDLFTFAPLQSVQKNLSQKPLLLTDIEPLLQCCS